MNDVTPAMRDAFDMMMAEYGNRPHVSARENFYLGWWAANDSRGEDDE